MPFPHSKPSSGITDTSQRRITMLVIVKANEWLSQLCSAGENEAVVARELSCSSMAGRRNTCRAFSWQSSECWLECFGNKLASHSCVCTCSHAQMNAHVWYSPCGSMQACFDWCLKQKLLKLYRLSPLQNIFHGSVERGLHCGALP